MNKKDFQIQPNSGFNTKYCEIAGRLKASGFSLEDVAYALGMSLSTIRTWQNKHPLFKRAIEDGKEVAKSYVLAQAFKAACGYDYEERNEKYDAAGVLKETSVFKKEMPPNPKLIMWLLCNMDKEHWQSEHKITVESERNINVRLDGKIASAQIEKLAGRLLDEPQRRTIDAVVTNAEVTDYNTGGILERDSEGDETEHRVSEAINSFTN